MGRAPRKQRNAGYQNYNNPVKENRDYVAIVSKNKMVGIWTGSEESSKYVMAPNDRDTRLGALELFDEVLDRIPTNDQLLDRQVVIYSLDCLFDCIMRPGDVVRSEKVSDEAKAMIPGLIQKYIDRSFNCFLMSAGKSNAEIVRGGFDWLQDISERTIAEANGVHYEKKSEKKAPAEFKSPLQVQQEKLNAAYDELDEAYDNDDEAKAAKLESKIERLKARIADLQASEGAQAQA